jgi:transcriptional regulator with XRE-family HTH domain
VSRQISQTELGDKLGVSFQQIQKYENGANRIAAGRLQRISEIFDVPIGIFFGTTDSQVTDDDRVLDFLQTANAIRLVKAFAAIQNAKQRRALVRLAEEIAANQ